MFNWFWKLQNYNNKESTFRRVCDVERRAINPDEFVYNVKIPIKLLDGTETKYTRILSELEFKFCVLDWYNKRF